MIRLIRHDVDRKSYNALRMARIEQPGVKSTYYLYSAVHFKKINKRNQFLSEIGYHYESLSDTNGNITEAINDFKKNLGILREICSN